MRVLKSEKHLTLKQLFQQFDTDGSGNLDASELEAAMDWLGMCVPPWVMKRFCRSN